MTDITRSGGDGRFGAAAPGALPARPPLDPVLDARDAPAARRLITWRRMLAVGVAVILAAGAYVAGYYAAPGSPASRLLLVTSVPLAAGARLSASDLSVVRVETGVSAPAGALSSTAAASLTGLVTRTALPPGTFLTRSLLDNSGAVPASSQALVGLALKPGQVPADGLTAGQHVLVILLPVNSSGVPLKPVPLIRTTVWDEQGPDTSGTTHVTVVVPAKLAVRLAGYAAQSQVTLVQTGVSPDGGA